MRRWICLLAAAVVTATSLFAQDYPELRQKLDAYFAALAGEPASVQSAECDFLIESCQDSLVRQFVTLHIYDHYLRSKIMGDDAVAVHIVDTWLAPGKVQMHADADLMNAKVYAEFNRHSLIGAQAPVLWLKDPESAAVRVPSEGTYSLLFFYDTSCSTCRQETLRLKQLVAAGTYPVEVFAVYVGDNAASWASYREDFPGVTHLWDPQLDSDWQRQYGVLQTPRMFLVSPTGEILGRGLDTPAVQILLDRSLSREEYVYGDASQMERLDQLFASYGDSLSTEDVLEVADYLAARTFGEGDLDAFKQVTGDLLYYLSSHPTEAFRGAVEPFVDRFIQVPDVWTSPADTAQVLSLANMLTELSARTPVGSALPDLTVHGVLRRRPCLFVRGSREGAFPLARFKGKPGYVVFYSQGCSSCTETLEAVEALVKGNRKARVLLVDMDALFTDHPAEATAVLDRFDLSALPFVLETDKDGVVTRRYVDLRKNH